ncbi:MAG: tRNA (cytidine(34)-2'-O)-methyltransferase [Elusimicrobia bacterium]|nr:tRNA (cytidine(34)-2'-O)-methyltransferase [Elusimicrobiota bacterium]
MRIVLYEPEIPWNTGNIGRTCVAAGAALHLIKPLGFRIGGKEIRRAGLDYWSKLRLHVHDSFPDFLSSLPEGASVLAFSTKAKPSFRDAPYREDSYLIFGGESCGLPEAALRRYSQSLFRIPQTSAVRSLNLSTAAALVLYEGLRRVGQDPQ